MAASFSATKLLSQAMLMLLFLCLLVISSASNMPLASTPTSISTTASFTEPSARKLLLSTSSHHQLSHREFHPYQNMNPAFSSSTSATNADTNKRSFRAAAHEVPSGPNPESNK